MINYKKEQLIKKYLGCNTPKWVVENCISLLNEFEEIEIHRTPQDDKDELKNKNNPLSKVIYSAIEKTLYVTEEDIKSKKRNPEYVMGRMFLSWEYKKHGFSYVSIAMFINKKHCTIIHYLKQHDNRIETDKMYVDKFEQFKKLIE